MYGNHQTRYYHLMQPQAPCYLQCGGTYKHLFNKNGYTYLRCNKCGFASLATDINYESFLTQYYQQSYFEGGSNITGYNNYTNEKSCIVENFKGYLQTISKYIKKGNHLDIGCAAGYFIELMLERGYDSYGTDVSQFIVSHAAQNIRPRIHLSPFHQTNYKKNNFDLITMFDIIEHINDPLRDLSIAHKILKKNGLLCIVTGNIRSLYAKALGKHNHFFAGPHHLMLFDHKTIRTALHQSGFKTLSIHSKGKWLTYEYLNQIASLSHPIINQLLTNPLTSTVLNNKKLYFHMGDTMLVIAQKV